MASHQPSHSSVTPPASSCTGFSAVFIRITAAHHGFLALHFSNKNSMPHLNLGACGTDPQIYLGGSASWDSCWYQLPHHSGVSQEVEVTAGMVDRVLITVKRPDRITQGSKNHWAHSFRGFRGWFLGPTHLGRESW